MITSIKTFSPDTVRASALLLITIIANLIISRPSPVAVALCQADSTLSEWDKAKWGHWCSGWPDKVSSSCRCPGRTQWDVWRDKISHYHPPPPSSPSSPQHQLRYVLSWRKIRAKDENISGALSWLGEKTGDTVQVRQNHQYSPDKTEMRRAQDDPVKIVHRKSICRLNRLGSVCWPRDVTSVFCHGYKRPWVSWSFTCFSKLSLS